MSTSPASAADWDEFYPYNPKVRAPYGAAVATEAHTRKVQKALKDIGCYTDKVDGWWWSGSKNAFEAVRTKSGGFQASAKASRGAFVRYLQGLPAGYCATSAKYCNLPTAGKKWLNDQSSEKYGDAFATISKIFDGYTNFIKVPPSTQTDWLASSTSLDNVQRDLAFNLKSALDLRRKLASTWALTDNPSCARCVLLVAYEKLEAIAKRPTTGKPFIAEAGKANILLETITFPALKDSHKDIKAWIVADALRQEKFEVLRGSSGNSNQPAVDFGNALRAAETAKDTMLSTLRTQIADPTNAGTLVPTKVLKKKSEYCGTMTWDKG